MTRIALAPAAATVRRAAQERGRLSLATSVAAARVAGEASRSSSQDSDPPTVAHRKPSRPQPRATLATAITTRDAGVGHHQRAVLRPPIGTGQYAQQRRVQAEAGQPDGQQDHREAARLDEHVRRPQHRGGGDDDRRGHADGRARRRGG